jgi:hypothetical protein
VASSPTLLSDLVSMVAIECSACPDSMYLGVNSIIFTVRCTVQHFLLSVLQDNASCENMPHSRLF